MKHEYRVWRMYCDMCKGHFSYTCWQDERPVRCACTGVLVDKDSSAYRGRFVGSTAYVPPAPRITSTDPEVILKDIEDPRWPEHLGG